MEDPAASLFYAHPTFSLFPNNSLYQATDTASNSTHDLQQHPPRSMMYTSIGNFNTPNFSAADSLLSPSGSASLSNSDDSPSHSPVDYITSGDDQASAFSYGPDLFDQLKVIFTPPIMHSIPCPSDASAEMNQHFVVKQEHQQDSLFDSYTPYIDISNESLSYRPSHHSHTADANPEHFGTSPLTTPSLTYGFPNGFHDLNGPSSATLSSDDLIRTNDDYNPTAEARYSTVRSSNVIAQQPCAQPIQLSPQCVQTQELPHSPPVSLGSSDAQVCDPRFVAGHEDDGRLSEVPIQMENGKKRKRRNSTLSPTSTVAASPSTFAGSQAPSDEEEQEQYGPDDREYEDSGESEAEDDTQVNDDNSLGFGRRTRPARSVKARRRPSCEAGPSSLARSHLSFDAFDGEMEITAAPLRRTRGLTAPVPVPNLTKKSRGRRVPTASTIVSEGGIQKNSRTYTCKVKDCGKCFARGEHLKRHIRSIHTHEKPHTCPFPGCNKDFSRLDNLGQHLRVHGNYSPPQDFA